MFVLHSKILPVLVKLVLKDGNSPQSIYKGVYYWSSPPPLLLIGYGLSYCKYAVHCLTVNVSDFDNCNTVVSLLLLFLSLTSPIFR